MVEALRPLIIDTTLRDGEQMPGVCFTPAQKLELAQRISDFGADVIEVMPIVSPAEAELAKGLARMQLKAELRAVCRLKKEDIEASAATGVERLLLVAPSSDLHLKVKLGIGREEGLVRILEHFDYARTLCSKVDIALEDASRADEGYLCEISDSLSEKIGLLLIGDTLGVLTPFTTQALISKLKARSRPCRLEFHGHNDFGLATANTVAAVMAGADAFTATFLGIGERAGNASMEEVLVALKHLEGVDAGVKFKEIAGICASVAEALRLPIPPNKPWAGSNAFTHESGIHMDAVLKEPKTYEHLQPSEVGASRNILFGKFVGMNALSHILKEAGVSATSDEIRRLKETVAGRSREQGSSFTAAQVLGIFEGIRHGSG